MMMADGSQGRVFPFRCPEERGEEEEEGDEIRDRVPRTLNGEEGLHSVSLAKKAFSEIRRGGRQNSKGLCMAKSDLELFEERQQVCWQ